MRQTPSFFFRCSRTLELLPLSWLGRGAAMAASRGDGVGDRTTTYLPFVCHGHEVIAVPGHPRPAGSLRTHADG